jgi:ABC-type uncharacterized transport system involved in gliding motility auxiliary subunit
LRIEFGTTESSSQLLNEPVIAPKKHGWLPLLVVLFLISYALMTMLIIEQGQTIESQRVLIRELFRDSTELSATKMKAQQDAHSAATQAQNQAQSLQHPSSQAGSAQTPSQTPSTQAPKKHTPSSQAGVQNRAQNQKPKTQMQMPARPAADVGDNIRSLITI